MFMCEGLREDAKLIFPNTIGVGFGRCGTTYISHVLTEHPDVCFSSRKETHFFSRHYRSGLQTYSRYFDHCRIRRARIVAEWSVLYILNEEALLRIRRDLTDDVKVLVVYRDPVEGLRSALRFRITRGKADAKLDVRMLIDRNWDLVENRFYDVYLDRLFRIFPRRNVYIMCFEDMVHNPELFFRNLYEFLGIRYLPVHKLVPRLNVPRATRSRFFLSLLYRFLRLTTNERTAHRLLKAHSTEQPRWLRILQGWNTKDVDIEFDSALRTELGELFAPHMRNLELMLLTQSVDNKVLDPR